MRPTSFPLTRMIFVVILLVCQAYLLIRILSYVRTKEKGKLLRILASTPFVLFNLPVFYLTFFRPSNSFMSVLIVWMFLSPFYVWQFSSLIIVLLILVGKIVGLPFAAVLKMLRVIPSRKEKLKRIGSSSKFQKFDQSRRAFVRTAFWGSTAYVVGSSAHGVFLRSKYERLEKTLLFPNLPRALNGLTIGLISDIHSGPYLSKDEIDEYVRVVNAWRPDIVFLPGDFVTIDPSEIYPVKESLRDLRAPLGVYGCLGNHEFYTGRPDDLTKELEDAGVRILRNENLRVRFNDTNFSLIGIDDLRHGDNFPAAMSGVQGDDFKILLCHKPYFFPRAAESAIDLVLSGHTHGGQVVFVKVGDFALAPATFVSPYVAGLYEMGRSQMYVSRGVGTIGVPFRINCPPEVTKLILIRT